MPTGTPSVPYQGMSRPEVLTLLQRMQSLLDHEFEPIALWLERGPKWPEERPQLDETLKRLEQAVRTLERELTELTDE